MKPLMIMGKLVLMIPEKERMKMHQMILITERITVKAQRIMIPEKTMSQGTEKVLTMQIT